MHTGKLVFAQLMEYLPLHTFRRCVAKYAGAYPTLTFSHFDQYLCMTFAQLTYRESLRHIGACLRAHSSKLYHQALDRTQPGLPLKKGRCGTTTLFAALNVLDGKVIGQCQARHRHQEWLKFLRRLEREFPKPLTLHLIMDNYGTHK